MQMIRKQLFPRKALSIEIQWMSSSAPSCDHLVAIVIKKYIWQLKFRQKPPISD